MTAEPRATALTLTSAGLIALGSLAFAQGPATPRPGLTAQQTSQAVEIARGAMVELRKKTEGAAKPDVDQREYVVGVELLAGSESSASADAKDSSPKEDGDEAKEKEKEKKKNGLGKPDPRKPGPRAVVTSYRYFDDITVFSTVDLGTGRVVDVQAAQHLRTPLSDGEYEDAKTLAREQSDEVRKLFARYADKINVYPQFSQYIEKDDPRVHRVVHLTYRIGTRDLSYPRPIVDLTTRTVKTPPPEETPKPRRNN